jgi:hypothetical protein
VLLGSQSDFREILYEHHATGDLPIDFWEISFHENKNRSGFWIHFFMLRVFAAEISVALTVEIIFYAEYWSCLFRKNNLINLIISICYLEFVEFHS